MTGENLDKRQRETRWSMNNTKAGPEYVQVDSVLDRAVQPWAGLGWPGLAWPCNSAPNPQSPIPNPTYTTPPILHASSPLLIFHHPPRPPFVCVECLSLTTKSHNFFFSFFVCVAYRTPNLVNFEG